MTSIIHQDLNKNLSQWKSLQKLLITMKVTKFQKIFMSKNWTQKLSKKNRRISMFLILVFKWIHFSGVFIQILDNI